MAGDPVEEAFEKLMGELYWVESLEEAIEKLAGFLESMDPDLREMLLERRKKLCSDAWRVASILGSLVQAAEGARLSPGAESRLAFVSSMVASAYLMQCTRKWQKLDPRTKAEVLAPLYRASYALKMAQRDPENEALIDEAERMLEHALSKAYALGILDELREFIARVADNITEGG